MKKLLLLILSLVLVFAFVSCDGDTICAEHKDNDKDGKCDVCQATVDKGECEHEDADEDGKCDECGDDMGGEVDDSTPLALIENGEAKFQIVASKMCGTKISKAINDFIKDMGKLGVEITFVNDDKEENIVDCEILVGDVSSRGEKYDYDEHTLGIKGSVVTRIDNKIIITAGSTDYIIDAFENFCKDVIGLTKNASTDTVANVSFEKKQESLKVQSDYRVTAIKIGETEIKGYTIALDKTNNYHLEAATALQKTFYERAGYWLPMVSLEEAGEKSIIIKSVPKGTSSPAGKEGFLIRTENGKMEILCAYDNMLVETMNSVTAKIIVTQGEYVFNDNSEVLKKNISVLYYKDWDDIKGDGVTNDFEAIKALHEFANAGGQKVVAENGKEYYIEKTGAQSIEIQTDVDFGTSTFIIDDQFIEDGASTTAERKASIFKITSKHKSITYTLDNDPEGILERINAMGGLEIGTTEIPLNLGYDAMIIPYDSSKRIYMRWGTSGMGAGEIMSEIIVVRKDNKVEMSSTNMFDFDNVDKIVIYPIDEETLTLKGGTFRTIATRADMATNRVYRNMAILRSNVVVDGMDHQVENEPVGNGGLGTSGAPCTGLLGPSYDGWFTTDYCTDVTAKNCKFSGRVHYNQGSYDISGTYANNISFINCTQYNMLDENGKLYDENTKYWGIMGSNYCKNITLDGCKLSRFDAHAGVYNFTIKNTEIGFIKAVGGGHAKISNVKIYNWRLVTLREDYASSWKGDFYIKDIIMVDDGSNTSFTLFHGTVHDADFGFHTQMPDLYIENVICQKYDGTERVNPKLTVFTINADGKIVQNNGVGEKNSITPAKKITIKQPENFKFTSINSVANLATYIEVEYLD